MTHKKDRFFEDLEEEISFSGSTPDKRPVHQGVVPIKGAHTNPVSDRGSRPHKSWPHRHNHAPGTKSKPTWDRRPSHTVEAREQMGTSGVAVIVFVVDLASRSLMGQIRLETRGLAEVHEARNIHRLLIKSARESYEETLRDVPDIEDKDLIKIIKMDVAQDLSHSFGRSPVIIPVIVGL